MSFRLSATWFSALALLCCVVPAGAADINKDQFKAFVAKVEASAKGFIDKDQEDPDINNAVAGVRYGDDIIPDLTAAVNATRTPPYDAYVVAKLLYPLMPDDKNRQYLTPEQIRKVLPMVKAVTGRQGKYLPFPTYNKDKLKEFQIPPTFAGGNISADMVAKLGKINDARAEKMAKDRPVAIHNLYAGQIHALYYRLIWALDDPKEDSQLVQEMANCEKENLGDFCYLVQFIKDRVAEMPAGRAKRLNDDISKLAQALKWKSEWTYSDYANPALSQSDNSKPGGVWFTPYTVMYALANSLAAKGGAAQLVPLTADEYKKGQDYIGKWRDKNHQPKNAFPPDAEVMKAIGK